MEIVPNNVSHKDLINESNRRSAKAGYTTRLGEPPYRTKIMSMPVTKEYQDNYERIFKHS
jgi:hypothetical protein